MLYKITYITFTYSSAQFITEKVPIKYIDLQLISSTEDRIKCKKSLNTWPGVYDLRPPNYQRNEQEQVLLACFGTINSR